MRYGPNIQQRGINLPYLLHSLYILNNILPTATILTERTEILATHSLITIKIFKVGGATRTMYNPQRRYNHSRMSVLRHYTKQNFRKNCILLLLVVRPNLLDLSYQIYLMLIINLVNHSID
jgi:hypothetical protein